MKKLTDLPNIGKATAADLVALGIHTPAQLTSRDPMQLYRQLEEVTGARQDPCVLYTFMAVHHFLHGGQALPWWDFTEAGKRLLADRRKAPGASRR
jgi:DNA transformation protein